MMGNANNFSSGRKAERTMEMTAVPMPSPLAEDQVHVLVAQEGDDSGLRIEVGAEPVSLGRSEEADIQLPDRRVSKKHCQLRLVNNCVQVTDLGSTNGTIVEQARVQGSVILPVGARLRVGRMVFLHELRSRRDVQKTKGLESDLRKACEYVQALLPPPLSEGPVRTDWCFIPCAILGGDAFGYHDLDADRLALYLLDVCGHGAGAAMHSVTALNALRQQALPGIDFGRPDDVLRGLNNAFDMDRHNGMYFTLWYGVYDRRSRSLIYASGGHPPAFLIGSNRREAASLQTRSMPVGTFPGQRFQTAEMVVEPGSTLYIFSDGVFEIVTRDGKEWNLSGFRELVLQDRVPGANESVRLKQAVENLSQTKELADDFSLLVAEFN